MRGYWGRAGRLRQMMMSMSVVLVGCLLISVQLRDHTFPPQLEAVSFTNSDGAHDIFDDFQVDLPPKPETFDVMDNRPLFSPSRRPSQSQIQQSGDRKEEFIGKYLLQGIVIGEAQRLALLVDPATNKTLRLTEGEYVGGWVAREIHEDFVRFEARGVEKIIRLPKSGTEPGKLK